MIQETTEPQIQKVSLLKALTPSDKFLILILTILVFGLIIVANNLVNSYNNLVLKYNEVVEKYNSQCAFGSLGLFNQTNTTRGNFSGMR